MPYAGAYYPPQHPLVLLHLDLLRHTTMVGERVIPLTLLDILATPHIETEEGSIVEMAVGMGGTLIRLHLLPPRVVAVVAVMEDTITTHPLLLTVGLGVGVGMSTVANSFHHP